MLLTLMRNKQNLKYKIRYVTVVMLRVLIRGEIMETELLNKIYALFIHQNGMQEKFNEFLEGEALNIFFGEQTKLEIN